MRHQSTDRLHVHQKQDGDWWGRNWKWFLPVGCLGSLVLFAGFAAIIIFAVFGVMKSSDVYKMALSQATAHESVQSALGTPIEGGLFMTGNINVNNSSGHANLSIPISGPDENATINAVATKTAGHWTFSTLVVVVKQDGQRIDLLTE